jgi:hypothetical protein
MVLATARAKLRGPRRRCPLAVERLENRILLAGDTLATAMTLPFTSFQTAHAAGFLASSQAVDLYQVQLNPGDAVRASVTAQTSGSGLQSILRVFDGAGRQLALDDQEGGDPRLTFQAPTAGTYYLGISAAGNDAYDPNAANNGHGSRTTGLFTLDLRRTPGAPLLADLAGSSFRLATDTATYGDTLSGTFTVENHGGAGASAFAVQVVLSPNSLFGPQSFVLTTFSLPSLRAGQAFSPGGFMVTLPELATSTAAGLPVSGPVYLGLRIDPAGVVPELNSHDQSSVHRGEDWEKLTIVTPVMSSGSNDNPANSEVLGDLNSQVSGVLIADQSNWYQLSVPATGRLTAVVTAGSASTLVPRLTLAGPSGHVLIQSDNAIMQHLLPGTYLLSVAAASGAGTYQLTSEFVQGNSPLGPSNLGITPFKVVVADLNGDGIPDIVAANVFGNFCCSVSVLLGNGDGTFEPPQTIPVDASSFYLAVGDVNGDGKPDLIIANFINKGYGTGDTVSVLLGNGDGTFGPARTFAVGKGPDSVAIADVNGDGIPDLVVGTYGDFSAGSPGNTVAVLLGKGDGTFGPPQTFVAGQGPSAVAVADLNGDGKPDLIVANQHDRDVSVLLGNGDGTFGPQQTFATGKVVSNDGLAVADLNGDGKPDIITANWASSNTVSVLLNNGEGTFQPQQTFATGTLPYSVAVADVNGDGKPDLIVSNQSDSDASVLLGNGDGTFRSQKTFALGLVSLSMNVADLNSDGKPDLIANGTVLLGNGDGTFQDQPTFAVGTFPRSIAMADLNGDGKPDIVTANFRSRTVSVLLGNGDGTFQTQKTFPVGLLPTAVAVADVNGDGKPDLIVTGNLNRVAVLLGNGDGTFQSPHFFPVGSGARTSAALAVTDLKGDGKPDIITADSGSNTVSVLLDQGDGSFGPTETVPLGHGPHLVAVADVNGDGKPDLVVGNFGYYYGSSSVSVLLGNGDGTFRSPQTIPVDSPVGSVTLADFKGDGKPDLVVVTNNSPYKVSVLPGKGDGTFGPARTVATPDGFPLPVVADLNGDGKPDLVLAYSSYANNISVLLGNGDGTFQPPQTFPVGLSITSVAVGDVNGDGKPDIVTANRTGKVSVLLGNGDGTFTPITPTKGVGLRNTPYLADLTGDGLLDSVVLDGSGNILFRKGLRGTGSPFAPPVILNPRRPARDLTVLRSPTGWAVAAADTRFDPGLSGPNHFVYTVSLYTATADGTVRRTTAFSTTLLPTRIAAADLTGSWLDDLVVANSLDNSIQVAFQQPDGTFGAPITLPTGADPSDITVADTSGAGLLDIMVNNQASGDVSVFLNDKSHSFATSYRFRCDTSLYGLDTATATPTVSSLEQSVGLAAGDFTGQGRNDVVVVNRGSDSFSVLSNDGAGGFADPQPARITSTSDGLNLNTQAGPVVAEYFHGPDQPLDLAVLMLDRAEVWIFTGNGDGTFHHTFTIAAGASPTGLNVFHNPQTGQLDLLVGNSFGDVLHLQGKGDGTFQIVGSRVSLAVQDMGGGRTNVLVANQQTDRVTVQASQPGSPQFIPVVTLADGTQSTLAPGAVQWAKLDKDSPFSDAVVVASGGNEILVYRGTGFDAAGHPTFDAPVSYPVGTDPVSVTIQDLNGDGIPDMLVVDQGSNDIAELFGSWDASGHWVGMPGPRLHSGGVGPIAVAVRDVPGTGNPELVVTNGQSGTITVLPGVGQGFFNDQNPQVLNVPGNPTLGQGASLFGASNSGVVVTAEGQLLSFNLDDFAATVRPVLAAADVTAVQALADGSLIVAEQGGTVALLQVDAFTRTYQAVQVATPLDGIPFNPSALDVLQSATGLTVLVTEEGLDQLFAYALPFAVGPGTLGTVPFQAGASISLPLLVAPEPVPLTTPPSTAPLLLVVTLAPGPLSGAEPEVTPITPDVAVLLTLLVDSGTAEVEELTPPLDIHPQDSTYGLGIPELLRRLELAPKTEGSGPDRNAIPLPGDPRPGTEETRPPDAASERSERPHPEVSALPAFWQAVGDGRLEVPAPLPGARLALPSLSERKSMGTTEMGEAASGWGSHLLTEVGTRAEGESSWEPAAVAALALAGLAPFQEPRRRERSRELSPLDRWS